MEAGRLLSALERFLLNIRLAGVQRQLQDLVAAMRSLAAQPTDTSLADAFRYVLAEAYRALNEAASAVQAQSVRHVITNAGFTEVLPDEVLRALQAIMAQQPFILSQAAAATANLSLSVDALIAAVDAAINALNALSVRPAPRPIDGFEVGVLMPSAVVKGDLRTVTAEFEEWCYVFDRIQELVDGQPASSIPITSISTGSLDIYLGLHANGTYALLVMTAGVYAIFKMARHAQSRRVEMERERYSPAIIAALVQHENELIGRSKDEIVEKLLELAHTNIDSGRKNEMRTALRRSVDFVVRRVNQGVDLEVSTPPTPNPQKQDADAKAQELAEKIAKIEALRAEAESIMRSLPDRSQPLLQLPEPEPPASAAVTGGSSTSEQGNAENRIYEETLRVASELKESPGPASGAKKKHR